MLVIRTTHSQAVSADAGRARRAFTSEAVDHLYFAMNESVLFDLEWLSCARRSHVHPL